MFYNIVFFKPATLLKWNVKNSLVYLESQLQSTPGLPDFSWYNLPKLEKYSK
jgi:hypothetical protein